LPLLCPRYTSSTQANTRRAVSAFRSLLYSHARGEHALPIRRIPERAAIDAEAISGASLVVLAERYGRSKNTNTLNKHVRHHIPDSVQKALAASTERAVDAGDAILGELQRLKDEARRRQQAAEKKHDLRAAIAALRELRGAIELTRKIVGQLHETVPVSK
jgi:hypothetical protein